MSNDLLLSLIMVVLGYAGVLLSRKNMIFLLIQLEILYNGVMIFFVLIGYPENSEMTVIYFMIILALIAAESVVGLVLTILYFKAGRDINMYNLSALNG